MSGLEMELLDSTHFPEDFEIGEILCSSYKGPRETGGLPQIRGQDFGVVWIPTPIMCTTRYTDERWAIPYAASKTNLPSPRLTQHRLKAFMATVPGPIKEAHVIILHRPVCFHHCLLCWQPGVHLINESLAGAQLSHQSDGGVIWVGAHSVRIW